MTAPAAGARRAAGLVVPALLLLLSLLQSPGRVTFDTDLGLALNPTHLLHRALYLWSAENGFGGVGDQTYGFLFPIGPFFALGDLVGLPPWLVQRLWCALVLVLAYEGARRLVRRMVTPSVPVTVLGGLAWAVSTRMLTVVGQFSSEALTVALAPWLLLPLVCYLERDLRRTVWLSGVVVLGLGAANAGATLAVLPLPVLYLLTRSTPWRRRLHTTVWWSVAVGLASLWWIGPLLLLGANSPRFVDWVESARTTTDPVTGLAALRGTTDWVAYVPQGSDGFWPAGWELATSRGLLLATGAVAVLGLAGLVSRRLPERRFLLLSALLGFALLTLGHEGNPGSLVASGFRAVLDGPAVPFRNVYKLDPVLRLPLVLGLAHAVDRARRLRVPVQVVALAAVLLAALPAFQGILRPGPSFQALPSWWQSAASYVAEHGGSGRTLVLPEATAGQYRWGRTIGEPLEALATSPWAVRNQVPLTQPGNTRLVDAVEAVLASGRGSPALADVLARLGVSQLLIRGDLDRATAGTLPPARVQQALGRSAGLIPVATFGPLVRGSAAVDGGLAVDVPALEVWSVDRPVAQVSATPMTSVTALAGGPEDLVALLEQGMVDGPTVLATAGDLGSWTGPRVQTDGLQRRERSFGRVHDALGPLLTADDPFRQVRPEHDLLPPGDVARQQTVAAYAGLRSVTASSSAADPDSFSGTRSGTGPGAALDANVSTSWTSGPLRRPVGQWLQVARQAPTSEDTIRLVLVNQVFFGPTVTSVRLETDAGSVVRKVAGGEAQQLLALPSGTWSRLRITIASVAGDDAFGAVGIRELVLPGAPPTRTVVLRGRPPAGDQLPAVLLRTADPVSPCLELGAVQHCDATAADAGDETVRLDRTFTMPAAGALELHGTVLPQDGPPVERLLAPQRPHLAAVASSSLDAGPVGAHAAVDADPATSWIAGPGDVSPTLTLSWPAARRISEIDLTAGTSPRASFPARVHVHAAQGNRDADVGGDGVARFAALRTDRVTLTFPSLNLVSSTGATGAFALPLGIAEISVPGAGVPSLAPDPASPTGAFCGFGPDVDVDGTVHHTRVTGTVKDLLTSTPLSLEACDGPLRLQAGVHRLRVSGTFEFRVRSVALTPSTPVPAGERDVRVKTWGSQHRTVDVASGPAALLSLPEAAGPGWHATLDGHELKPLMVDGWAQGWVVPSGTGGLVHLDFTPDGPYRLSLLVGLLAVLLLLVLALLAARSEQHDAPVVHRPAQSLGLPLVLVLAVAVTVVGSWPAAAGFVVAVLAVRLRHRTWAALLGWALPALAIVVVAADTGTPVFAGQGHGLTQALCLACFGILAGLLTEDPQPQASTTP